MRAGVFFILSTSVASAAHAAPWPQSDDGFYARTLVAHETLDGLEGWRADAYVEYGLTKKLTVTAKAEAVQFADAPYLDGEAYRLTLRRGLVAWKGWQVGIEAGPVYGAASPGLRGCGGLGAELRVSGGISGVRDGRDFYAFADLGVTAREDECVRPRAEFGYGVDVGSRAFVGQQFWVERGAAGTDSNKYETQIGLHFSRFDAALGFRDTYWSDYDEQAILVTLISRR